MGFLLSWHASFVLQNPYLFQWKGNYSIFLCTVLINHMSARLLLNTLSRFSTQWKTQLVPPGCFLRRCLRHRAQRESYQESVISSIPADAENHLYFHDIWVLRMIIGHPVFTCHTRETQRLRTWEISLVNNCESSFTEICLLSWSCWNEF